MALISSMGNSSSPLFLQSGESLGLNIAPLEYYYKKKEAADEDLAKKLAQKPKLNEFDEKLDALAGQKESLKNIYNQKMGVVNKGVEKYGGIWAMYANSDEGKTAISSLNDMTYNMQMAEDNKKRFLKNNESLTTEGGGNKRFLDKDFRAMVAQDGKSYLTNEGHQQFLMNTPGINTDGRLKELEFHRTIGTSKTVLDEVAALYSKVGETSWADSRYHAGKDEFGNVVTGVIETDGGASAFSYLNQVAKSGSSNKNQIDNAIGIISKSFSNEAKEGLVNELYDMVEGKTGNSVLTPQFNEKGKFTGFKNETLDLNKFETDDQYRNNTINNYSYQRANEIAASFQKSSATSTITMNTLGQTKSKSEIASEKAMSENLGHTLNIELDRIPPTSSNTVTGYILGDDGKYITNEYVSNDYTGLASIDAYASINKGLDESETPTKLSDMFAAGEFTIGDVNHKISAQLNPEVKKVIGIVTRNRNNTKEEQAKLLAAQEANRGKNPNTLNEESLTIYNKNKTLTETLGPQKFMKVVVNTGDADASKNYNVLDKQTLLPKSLASEVPVFGNNYFNNAAESHGAKWVNYDNQYESVEIEAYIPINLATGVYGNTEKQYHGNVAKIKEMNAANNKLLQNLQKSEQTNYNIMSSEK